MLKRRSLLVAPGLLLCGAGSRAGEADALAALRGGGVVAAFRHALAPGTFDPPGFRLDDCRTQRNLNDAGRAQARQLGDWFRRHGLQPAAVRSSPWCRCIDTATLAFGRNEVWAPLSSPVGSSDDRRAERLQQLRERLAGVRGGFEVWVTHQFVLSDLAGIGLPSGGGLVLRADAAGAMTVVARLDLV